ncbi:MAG: lipoprotein insertase outer membrane protein LolB [Sulfurimicrobium sp.]|nr:lipoprotein insertase outer membrane protein LolB [Sulfurimicrobium sp.]
MSCKNSSSWLWLLCLLLLGGCAAPPVRQMGAAVAPETFQLQGRIGVRYGTEGFSGNFSWRHGIQDDEILLLTPLGQAVARIERDATGVKLDTPDGHYAAQDVAELTQRILGWRLPLDGMQYWVTGQPAPDGVASISRDASLNITRLRQQQWEIEYPAYRAQGAYVLPARVVMRNGTLELKLVVDEWILP